MGNLRKVVLFLYGVYFLQTQAVDKYTDENRPYEFGFTIDGEQHRHEKKDENGIVMGEFGFITADGVYHVTVYATDENGHFKILSMKNIRVKPYPTSPGAGLKKSKSSTISAPQKDSIPESTNEQKTIKKHFASPAKSCSHCRLPTTTTTTVSPVAPKVSEKFTNSPSTENYNHNQNNNNFISKNPILLQNVSDQQEDYKSKTHQSNTPTAEENNRQKEQNNTNSQNQNLLPLQNLGYQEPNFKPITQSHLQQGVFSNNPIQAINPEGEQYLTPPNIHLSTNQQILLPDGKQNNLGVSNVGSIDPTLQNLGYREPNFIPIIPQSYSQYNNNQSHLQQDVVSNNPVQAINPDGEQYSTPQNIHRSTNQQISVTDEKQNNPSVSNVDNRDPLPKQDPISRILQEPINEDYLPNQGLPQNKQADNGVKNYNQNVLNNNNKNDYSEAQSYPQQQNYEEVSNIKEPNKLTISSSPTIISRQATQPHNEGDKSVLGNPKGERTPKSFGDFIQQSTGPEEFASTGPNLYRPSLPNPSDFSGEPVLLAAQIQKVDKNTNIYNKSPGESDGLPEGITEDDVTNLLYTFNYTVGFHGHHEKGYSNGAKQGYYYVTGRNGVRTRVDYVADEKGFHPKISQEILDIASEEVPKPETEKDEKYGLKGYEFKWLYFPVDQKSA